MALKASDLRIGDCHEMVVMEGLTRTDIARYAGASGSYGRIHVDEPYAVNVAGLPSVSAHGMHTMGMTSRCVTEFIGDDRLVRFGGRFTDQVWPDDTLTTRCVVEEFSIDDGLAQLEVVTVNQNNLVVFRGYATARIDS